MKIARLSALVLVNLVVVVALLEVGLRLAGPSLPGQMGVAARWVLTGQPYAQDWQPGWQQNRDHYYSLLPGIEDALQYGSPTVSFRLSTIELWEGGGIGFRTDPVDFFVDAVVVGDSFGLCFTERADCWVDQWRAQSGLGVVNLSQPVTGTTSHGRILADFGAPLEPALVVWQFFGNDFYDDYGLAVFRGELDSLDPVAEPAEDASLGGWLRRNSMAVAIAETALTGRFAGVPAGEQLFVKPYQVAYGATGEHRLFFGGQYEQIALDMRDPRNQLGLELSEQAFRQAQALVQQWNGQIAVVIIPTREEVYRHLTAPIMGDAAVDSLASARLAMRDLCVTLDLLCFDLLDVFRARAQAGEALYYADDMHLNPHGNAVLATALMAFLDAQGLAQPGS